MPTSIHLVAWNVNHRGSRKPLHPETLDAIAALAPDILVLTEFVDARHHAEFKQGLRDRGLGSLAVSLGGPHQNQVLTPRPPPPTGCTAASPNSASRSWAFAPPPT